MATTTLRFTGPSSTTLPVRLRFGDEDDAPPPTGDATLTLAAAVTSLQGSVPIIVGTRLSALAVVTALSGAVGLRYASDTQRPTVGAAHAAWQGAKAEPKAFTARYQRAQALALLQRPNWQVAQPTSAGITPRWADAGRAARLLVETGWHAAQPLRAARLHSLWEDAIRLRAGARTGWSAAIPLSHAPTRQSYQDADRACRRWVHEAFTNAWPLRRAIRDSGTNGLPVRTARQARYQEAWPPRPGRWVRPVQPPIPDACYVPGLPVRLVFSDAGLAGVLPSLRFYCERHGGDPQPGTVVVPIRSVYVTVNTLTLTRASDGALIPCAAFSMSLDVDSWTWQWQATLHADALPLITPGPGGNPVEVLATVNGSPYRLACESYARQRQFASTRISVQGRGRAAVLDAPYAPTLNHGNSASRTAQQLMGDVLTINGVGIGWDVDWGLTDWLVPGNIWALQGPYIAAILDIAGAAGGYVQPHDTAQTLRILPRYPAAPWDWASLTPDYELPASVIGVEGTEWVQKPGYNRVYVSGTTDGMPIAPVTRAGTAGGVLAPMVTHPLITHADAARQRGIAELSDTGRQARLSLRLPVLEETGVIKPGALVRYVDNGVPTLGLVRGTQIEWSRPTLRQVLAIETHPE